MAKSAQKSVIPVVGTLIAYKMKKANGKWSPPLYFLKQSGDHWFFKPVEDTESTLIKEVRHLYIAEVGCPNIKALVMCKHYGEWEPASHVCGKDCPWEN